MNPAFPAAVQNYEALSSLMGLMREAAASGQWDQLVALEKKCQERVQIMRQADARSSLEESERARKKALILKILADDASIRQNTQPWMEKLQWALRNTRQERKVRQAYTPSR
ncbi:flagellar protein FliT [Ferrovum myxofaciens]|uniref:Flagellar protein FliT n=1 Tax=Ferrovum myxofaciens TaxID=416213 RepID=A0A9E6MUZ2_9PROT|nr:flagellar protein FliT [Ferrovum myxofaciens]QKE38567.1 MAG: flagellar protein FliT [Ferrovum myxofaciens]QWY73760.1 MAG: flagellar protein FliT [Ferrovum myxofaciens]QWY76514.1 MAG: flagellar protein FliT [Ferrovum myxofaciens]